MAEDCWQDLRHGINLLNLLAFYPAPGNPAILAALESLLEEESLKLALHDLQLLEERLLQLPERAGPQLTAPTFSELEGGPLKELMLRLAQLNALYQGKQGKGATTLVQTQLQASRSLFEQTHAVQLALVHFHQLKS